MRIFRATWPDRTRSIIFTEDIYHAIRAFSSISDPTSIIKLEELSLMSLHGMLWDETEPARIDHDDEDFDPGRYTNFHTVYPEDVISTNLTVQEFNLSSSDIFIIYCDALGIDPENYNGRYKKFLDKIRHMDEEE